MTYHFLYSAGKNFSYDVAPLVKSLGPTPESIWLSDSGLLLVRVSNSTENALILKVSKLSREVATTETKVYNSSLGDN